MKLSFWSCHRVKSLGMPYQSSRIHNSIHTVVSNSAKFYPDVVFRKYTISTLFLWDLEVATGMDISDKPLSLRACPFKMKSEKSRCCLFTFRMKRTCSQLTFVYSRQRRFITAYCPTQFATSITYMREHFILIWDALRIHSRRARTGKDANNYPSRWKESKWRLVLKFSSKMLNFSLLITLSCAIVGAWRDQLKKENALMPSGNTPRHLM